MGKSYWMVVESLENSEITKKLGFTIYGVGIKYRRRAQRMQPGDRILFYISRTRKWTTTATITSHCFEERTPIWKSTNYDDNRPFRIKLAPNIVLDNEDHINALILGPRLEYVKRWAPEDWHLAFHDNLHLLPQRDFRLIESEMKRNEQSRSKSEGDHTSEYPKDMPSIKLTHDSDQVNTQQSPLQT